MSEKIVVVGKCSLIGLVALTFIAAGGAKLAGVEMVHQSFKNMGLPVFTGYLVGLLEVVAAVLLMQPKFRRNAALVLAVTMLGAMAYHLAFDSFSAAIPAIVLLALTLLIARQSDKAG